MGLVGLETTLALMLTHFVHTGAMSRLGDLVPPEGLLESLGTEKTRARDQKRERLRKAIEPSRIAADSSFMRSLPGGAAKT